MRHSEPRTLSFSQKPRSSRTPSRLLHTGFFGLRSLSQAFLQGQGVHAEVSVPFLNNLWSLGVFHSGMYCTVDTVPSPNGDISISSQFLGQLTALASWDAWGRGLGHFSKFPVPSMWSVS